MYRITDIAPDGIHLARAAEAWWEEPLARDEEALVEGVAPRRLREFRAGRHAAHAALGLLGRDGGPILRDEQRRPIWPERVLGSITHTRGLCLAAVGLSEAWTGIGIDAEPLEELKPALQRRIASEAELEAASGTDLPAGKLLFSIKEAAYKAFHPCHDLFLGFHEATVEIDPATSTFAAHLHPLERDLRVTVEGRFGAEGEHLFTLAWLP